MNIPNYFDEYIWRFVWKQLWFSYSLKKIKWCRYKLKKLLNFIIVLSFLFDLSHNSWKCTFNYELFVFLITNLKKKEIPEDIDLYIFENWIWWIEGNREMITPFYYCEQVVFNLGHLISLKWEVSILGTWSLYSSTKRTANALFFEN